MRVGHGDPSFFTVQLLSKNHKRVDFACGVEALDRYLKTQARQDMRHGFATIMVAVTDDDAVIAYYTISCTSFHADELDESEARRLPKYTNVPAILLGRFAVDNRFSGQGIGKYMLLHALDYAHKSAKKLAAYALVVDAKDEAASAFYRHYGFKPFPVDPYRLSISRKDIAKLL